MSYYKRSKAFLENLFIAESMTETKSYYRKSAHRVRELYKGRIIREWKSGDTIYFEITL